MKVTLNISEFKSKTFEDAEYPATPEESIQLIPIGKSGIHIKKKNRGSFTKYCGGKVTDACIQKAKNSSSSAIRKKAVFAENARGWARKHQEGGKLSHLPGVSSTYLSSVFVDLDETPSAFATEAPALQNPMHIEMPEVTTTSEPIKDIDTEKTETPVTTPSWLTTPYSGVTTRPTSTRTADAPAKVGTFGDGVSDTLRSSIEQWLGVPYQLGGRGPERGQGLDCSGFVSRVLGSMGSSLQGNCRALWSGTSRLNTQDLKPGDLVFLQDTQPGKVAHGKASHVAIVTDTSKLGEGKIGVAHSGGSGKKSNIVEWDLNKGYYSKHFLGAGRVIQNAKFGGKIDYTEAHE